ncbi:MAG: preprotein translocase subunit YajC, partial [Candidatus Goldiibacteriota bacterium]
MLTLLFAATGAPAVPGAGGDAGSMPMLLVQFAVIGVIFYFLLIRPQQKERKKLQQMLAALKEGDKVVTTGGIVGIITKINDKDDVVQITVVESTKLNVLRAYI